MPQELDLIPDGAPVFIDAMILVNGLNGVSKDCQNFLERCQRENLKGICLFEIVNEATHQWMIAEALERGWIDKKEKVRQLQEKPERVQNLRRYWDFTERALALNILLISTQESIIRGGQPEREKAGLLTRDSMIASFMRQERINALASQDGAFDRVEGITRYSPRDFARSSP